MCRLFGLLSGEPTDARPWLLEGDRSLLAQSHASEAHRQTDGWGIAWFGAARTAQMEKGTGGAFEPGERGKYTEAAERASGPIVVAHLRKASNPLHLSHARLIGVENSQPFTSGTDLFAHNGMIPYPAETRPMLGRFEARVKGVNDSEVLFWLFARHVDEVGDPPEAYARTVADLLRVWSERGRADDLPYTGLNLVYSRGPNDLWGFCHWLGEHGGGLSAPDRPYYQMTYTGDSKHVVIGSEPFDGRAAWRSLANGEYVHAQAAHGLVALRTGALKLPELPKGIAMPGPAASAAP